MGFHFYYQGLKFTTRVFSPKSATTRVLYYQGFKTLNHTLVNTFKKIRLRRKIFPLFFFACGAILPCIQAQNHPTQNPKISPAAQNWPLFRIQVLIFLKFPIKSFSKVLIVWNFLPILEIQVLNEGGVLNSNTVVHVIICYGQVVTTVSQTNNLLHSVLLTLQYTSHRIIQKRVRLYKTTNTNTTINPICANTTTQLCQFRAHKERGVANPYQVTCGSVGIFTVGH